MNPPANDSSLSHRRGFVGGAVASAATGLFLSSGSSKVRATEAVRSRKALRPEGAPSADSSYSPGILVDAGQLLFISGQGPKDIHADMETQIRQTFDRIGIILKEAGASWNHVVIIRSYWVHLLRDLAIFRKIRREYLTEPYPASTAVGTTELAIPGLELEIEAVAIMT
jgi:enamine deaminase RidA (YjgF/YER057c/UK114 family)